LAVIVATTTTTTAAAAAAAATTATDTSATTSTETTTDTGESTAPATATLAAAAAATATATATAAAAAAPIAANVANRPAPIDAHPGRLHRVISVALCEKVAQRKPATPARDNRVNRDAVEILVEHLPPTNRGRPARPLLRVTDRRHVGNQPLVVVHGARVPRKVPHHLRRNV